MADDARANDVTSTWRLLINHGKFLQFRMLGKAFRFQLNLDVIVPRNFFENPQILLDLVKDKFIGMTGCSDDDFIQRKGIKYLEVMCNLRPLTSLAEEEVGNTLNVSVKGYVQCKQCNLRWGWWGGLCNVFGRLLHAQSQ